MTAAVKHFDVQMTEPTAQAEKQLDLMRKLGKFAGQEGGNR
jgi:hypothetical protein